MSTALVVYQPGLDGTLFSRVGLLHELQGRLHELEAEHALTVRRIRDFELRFKPAVGDRHEELGRLRSRIARAWDAVARARGGAMQGSDGGPEPNRTVGDPDLNGARANDDSARLLFLALARQIHPDLAEDEEERQRRHDVMSEATLAYRNQRPAAPPVADRALASAVRTDSGHGPDDALAANQPTDCVGSIPDSGGPALARPGACLLGSMHHGARGTGAREWNQPDCRNAQASHRGSGGGIPGSRPCSAGS